MNIQVDIYMQLLKVLVVEDNPGWLRIFQILVGELTSDLFEYVYVTTLADTLEAVEREEFKLILLDLMLPGSHATNTIQTMSPVAKNIPTVVITTIDDEKLLSFAAQNGLNHCLIKDQYNLKNFLSIIRLSVEKFLDKDGYREMDERIRRLL